MVISAAVHLTSDEKRTALALIPRLSKLRGANCSCVPEEHKLKSRKARCH
jgi:hypothetical protein